MIVKKLTCRIELLIKKMSKCRENNGLLRGSKTAVGTFNYINDSELIHSRSHNKSGEERNR
jgi:hypothetical protein